MARTSSIVTITYLEMLQAPGTLARSAPPHTAIMHAQHINLSYYRYLYGAVGADWKWTDRLEVSDETLSALVRSPGIEVHVLYSAGNPAGYSELDFSEPGQAKLAYFGLLPEYIGRGLGGYFLDWSVRRLWRPGVRRAWVHTCTHDHPAALAQYQKAGFVVYATEEQDQSKLRRPDQP